MIASAETSACTPPSTAAVACGEPTRLRVRWVRWSRPPVSTEIPRRRRETITSAVSAAGTATSSSATSSPVQPGTSSPAPAIVIAATAKPIGIEPPSPRKIFAGEERLWGRKPRHAPARAIPASASQDEPSITPSAASPVATTTVSEPVAPSMLSKRLKALTTASVQAIVTNRSTGAIPEGSQPKPASQNAAASPASIATRIPGASVRRSSVVPTAHMTATPPITASVRPSCGATRASTATNAATTAAPPRYGVGAVWPL